MVKNRLLLVMTWVIVLLWVYARNRMTEAEYDAAESKRFREAINYDQVMKDFQEELDADPDFKAFYYNSLYELALEDVEMDLQ